jgi:hypothetical protein
MGYFAGLDVSLETVSICIVGPTSSWLSSELCSAVYAAICLECRHVKAGA